MIFTLSKLSLCIPSSSKPQLGCFVYLLEIQHHFNKADTLHILINLQTSLIPFTRSHITLHNYLTGPIHSQKLSLSTIYSLLCSSLRESTEATCKCIGQPNDTILPMLRRCNFVVFIINWSSTKVSSSKFHWQNFCLDQLECRIHVNGYMFDNCKG